MIYWSEHFFFDKKFNEYNELEMEKLYIQVFDHNLLRSNALIGEIEIDLIPVYFNEKHAILHQWAGLTNIKQNREEIKGYLKFSCSCIGPNDTPIQMKDEKYDEDHKTSKKKQLFTEGNIGEINQDGVLFPPYIKIKGWQIEIRLIKGENLVKMDTTGTIDTFLIFHFGTAKFKTKTIKNNPNPEWNMIINVGNLILLLIFLIFLLRSHSQNPLLMKS